MRARAPSIKLPLYKDQQRPSTIKQHIDPDSPQYRAQRPQRKHSRPSRWRTCPNPLALLRLFPIPRPTAWPPKRYMLLAVSIVLVAILGLFEIQIEVFFYSRRWIDREVFNVEPLAGCFDSSRVSEHYNVTRAFGPKTTEVQAGIPLRMGLDCYDLASTIQTSERHQHYQSHLKTGRTYYHTYWRADLLPFEERQEWLVKSFLATQDLTRSTLILWSNGDLSTNPRLAQWLHRFPDAFQLKLVDVDQLARGTALFGSPHLNQRDSRAWVDGDIVRLLVVWAYGGVWIDMDSLMTRDLSPLLEHEFFTQWDCYDKKYQPFNGALLHFEKHSPYLCEAFHIMAKGPPPRAGSVDWGSLLYLKLYRGLLAAGITPFKVLPFCFSDGRSCQLDNRLPDPFQKDPVSGRWPLRGPRMPGPRNVRGMDVGGALDVALHKVFSVHLHNQWEKAFPTGGWVERLLLDRYDDALQIKHNHTRLELEHGL